MRIYVKIFVFFIYIVFLFSQTLQPIFAQNRVADTKDYQEWADAETSKILDANHKPRIPGAVLTIVKDGKVILSKGYGYANVENKEAFDPDTTILRAASLTKTVTATAIMQLIEQKKLTPEMDVRNFFPDLFPSSSYPYPITIGNLLTHTGGFDETSFHYYEEKDLVSLKDYINQEVPAQVDPPGKILTYSNFGYYLLGRVIEIVSGKSYEEYVSAHIFSPLNMYTSTVHQPFSSNQLDHLAQGYLYNGKEFTPVNPQLYRPDLSAGGLTTTANDMAQFLIFHSQQEGGRNILSPENLRLMHTQHFTNNPILPGYTYGFYERFDNGRRILVHGGNRRDAASLLAFLPEQHVGLFVYVNTPVEISSGSDPREELLQSFLNTFYPEQIAEKPAIAQTVDKKFEGAYRITRYIHQGIKRAFKLDGPLTQATVKTTNEGKLQISYPFNIVPPTTWNQVGPLTFQRVDKPSDYMAFGEDDRGNIKYLFGTLVIPFSLERVSWFETIPFQLGIILVSLIASLLIILGSILVFLKNIRKKKMYSAKQVLRFLSCTSIFVIFAEIIYINMATSVDIGFSIILVKVLTILFLISTGACFVALIKAFKSQGLTWVDYSFFITLSSFFLFLISWGLLG